MRALTLRAGKSAPPPVGGPPQHYDFYRKSTIGARPVLSPRSLPSPIGLTLTDALDDLIQSGTITQTLGVKILKQFDAVRVCSRWQR